MNLRSCEMIFFIRVCMIVSKVEANKSLGRLLVSWKTCHSGHSYLEARHCFNLHMRQEKKNF